MNPKELGIKFDLLSAWRRSKTEPDPVFFFWVFSVVGFWTNIKYL